MTDEGKPETVTEILAEKIAEPIKAAILPTKARAILAGSVRIDWELPLGIQSPIGVYVDDLKRENYIVECAIRFSRGKHAIEIPAGYVFDGASIPRIFWGMKGFSPVGQKLWAALIHDWLCDEAARFAVDMEKLKPALAEAKSLSERAAIMATVQDALPLTIGDAIFVQVLLDTGEETWKSVVMYLAVRAHHVLPRASAALGCVTRYGIRTTIGGLAAGGLTWLASWWF